VIKYLLSLFCLVFVWTSTIAQYRCGTHLMPQNNVRPDLPGKPEFENWLNPRNAASPLNINTDSALLYVPVVFHIIHNGEDVGQGSNVPDQRITEQIQILNNDYQRLIGTMGFSNHPLSANSRIEFRLANRNPQGGETNAINRVRGFSPTYNMINDREIKALSFWPSDKYLNVWVVPGTSTTPLGWAQYPPATDGNPGTTTDSVTDGIIVTYGTVGLSSLDFRPYHRGRTLTHEIGHYLGLIHVWGDQQDCFGTDYCDDTPSQSGAVERCPRIRNTCSTPDGDLIPNYMQYSDDTCMHMFTNDQVLRMRRVLRNAPRRTSLLNSPGLVLKSKEKITSPSIFIFPNPATTEVTIAGINELSTFQVALISTLGVKYTLDPKFVDGSFTANISGVPKGIYTLLINKESYRYTFRLIVK